MKLLKLIQGTDEWIEARSKYRAASEASMMMGVSSKQMRSELVRMKATGDSREFSDWVRRNILDRGHEIEAQAREIADDMIGDELYPVTGASDDGELLASFDGRVMDGSIIWECKSWNEEKAASVRNGEIPEDDKWQVVQQLVVSGAKRCLYMVTDGTRERTVTCWAKPDAADEKKLRAGWAQFDEDVANYEPSDAPVEVVGKAPAALPTLLVEIAGEVKSSNLATYKDVMLHRIREINTDLQTDEDFADAAKTVTFLEEGEKEIERVKARALAQTESIDELFRAVDELSAEMRSKRLNLNRLVEARKKEIRDEIRQSGVDRLRIFMEGINAPFAEHGLTITVAADFAGMMKGKRTVASLRDAVDTELARVKIEANEQFKLATANLKVIEQLGERHPFLFADKRSLLLKPTDDLVELVKSRVITHEAEEQRKRDAERERIRQEELQRIEDERLAEELRQREEQEAAQPLVAEEATPCAPQAESDPIDWQPAVATPETRRQIPTQRAASGTARPSDQEIIQAVAKAFGVHLSIAIHWISQVKTQQVA